MGVAQVVGSLESSLLSLPANHASSRVLQTRGRAKCMEISPDKLYSVKQAQLSDQERVSAVTPCYAELHLQITPLAPLRGIALLISAACQTFTL